MMGNKTGAIMLKQPRIILASLSILIAAGAILANMMMLGGLRVFQSLEHAQGLIWSSLPYLVLILISMLASRKTLSAMVALAGTVFTAWVGMDSMYYGFYQSKDGQAGLVVIVLPMLQWALCGITVAAILLLLLMKWVVWPKRGDKAAA